MKKTPLIEERLKKLAELQAEGVSAFPNDLRPSHQAGDLQRQFETSSREDLETMQEKFCLAGRLMSTRLFGKAGFGHIQDSSGRIQLFFQKQSLSDQEFKLFKKADIGDIIWVEGTPMRTKTGELSLKVEKVRLASKSLRPLPEKWHGLTDVEQRYRQRYVDLIVNEPVKKVFQKRCQIIQEIRNFFQERGYMEVETPMLHQLAGGAAARPFMTHHNALDLDLKLRIAPELYLKRLVVGGFERVFEINRNFRNEGISTQHNPEFTMLEFYQAYAQHVELMEMTEQLISGLALKVCGSTDIEYQGQNISLRAPFARFRFEEALVEIGGLPSEILSDESAAQRVANEHEIRPKAGGSISAIHEALLEKFVEPKLVQPTFITDFPTAISPLARRNDRDPKYSERFEFFVANLEMANGFSELNDPIDQEERFRGQVEAAAKGDEEAMPYDADFIEALSYGMPPTAGEGVGIDRLVMLLTDQASIRDVIAFPLLKPKEI